jgi:hypothetical protein
VASPDFTTDPPETLADYHIWLHESHRVDVSDREEKYHEHVVDLIRRRFEESSFWNDVCGNLTTYEGKYRVSTGYPLFLGKPEVPNLEVKSFDSFLLKTFRRNVLDNPAFPDPPGDWLLPDNWYEAVDDLVRTTFVVKYLDGVNFVLEQLREAADRNGLRSRYELQARPEGYYAAHFYVWLDLEVPGLTWETTKKTVSVELHVTTQLQEVIRQLLHKYYEARRGVPTRLRSDWQWDYRAEEFVANYLGHILHYVEGMIMDVRGRQEEAA